MRHITLIGKRHELESMFKRQAYDTSTGVTSTLIASQLSVSSSLTSTPSTSTSATAPYVAAPYVSSSGGSSGDLVFGASLLLLPTLGNPSSQAWVDYWWPYVRVMDLRTHTDFPVNGETNTTDVHHTPTNDFAGCLSECESFNRLHVENLDDHTEYDKGCTAVSWKDGVCYVKTGVTNSTTATYNWITTSAVMHFMVGRY